MAQDRSALSDYLQGLYNIEPISKEEEYALALKIQLYGDEQALDRLVTHNLRFVILLLKDTSLWNHSIVPVEDLIAMGNLYLLQAARQWIPKNNARFITYAKPFILKGVRREVDNTAHIIRLPVNVSEEIKKMKYIERILMQELGRVPKPSELADKLEVTEKRVHQLRGYMLREPSSLEAHNQETLTEESED